MNDLANTLLVSFVQHFGQLYGQESSFITYICLVHLSEDIKVHGHLYLISGVPFENALEKQTKKWSEGYTVL
jgi:hypothetical protein